MHWIIYFLCLHADAIPTIKTLAGEPELQHTNVHESSTTPAALPSTKKGLVGVGVNNEDSEDAKEEMGEQNVKGAMKALLHWCQKNTARLDWCVCIDTSANLVTILAGQDYYASMKYCLVRHF